MTLNAPPALSFSFPTLSRQVPLGLLFSAALLPFSWAGGGDDLPPPGELLQAPCAAALQLDGVIGRTVALHTDKDDRLDLIAQVQDELIWVTAPDPLRYSSAIGVEGVTAFAALERSGTSVDALVVATSSGLEYVIRDAEQLRVFHAVRSIIGGAEWANCRSLTTADLDGDGDTDIVGLDASGQTLLRLDQESDGVFVSASSVALGAVMDELRSLRWTSGGIALAAVLRDESDTVCIFEPSGALLMAEPLNGVVADLAVLADAHQAGEDGLAVLAQGAISVMRPGGIVEPSVLVAPIAPTAMSSADVDGDGRSDLLLNSSTVDQIVTLLGQSRSAASGGTLVAPNAATSIVVSLQQHGAVMGAQLANPVGADFDRDGDIDLFQLIESTRTACIQRNAFVNEVEQATVLVDSEWYPNGTGGTIAFLHLDPMPMSDGQLPDFLEVTLSTSPVGASVGGVEHHKVRVLHGLGSATTGSGHELVTLDFPGELGEAGTLLLRGGRWVPGTGEVQMTGVEAAYVLGAGPGSSARGGDPNEEWQTGQGGPQSTPPPPLPE